MRGGRGAGKRRMGPLPAQLLAGGIEIDVGGALAGSGDGGYFGSAVKCRFHLVGEGWSGVGDGCSQRKRCKHGLGFRHGSLPVGAAKGTSFKTMRFRIYSRNRPERREFFKQSMAGIAPILAIKFGRTVTDR